MISFIVPVKSEQVTSDWLKFSQYVEATLISICNQTDQNFKVIVVCNEKPQINFEHPNIHYVEVDFEPPVRRDSESDKSLNRRRELDKGGKLKIGVNYATENFDTDYIMTVDSDDFISNKIAGFVNESGTELPGWYTKNGYIHLDGKPFLLATYKFSYLCGSSVIVKPELFNYFFNVDPMLYFDHRLTVLNNNIELTQLPFYGGVYSMANGENHFMSIANIRKFNTHNGWMTSEGIKRIYNKFKNYSFRFITKKIRKEYSFNR
ncbi:glycosyltransferase family A protein [uncultured Winogradskyella sp.]|uniref:glycosyltransferase family A protein n=1 Tax=uncultured Winogradskyella sp. TaxID=395353 RepID=UPI00260D3E74|nr:glycosyltransferase family A protein [uncultured Winogradskyella sp.]